MALFDLPLAELEKYLPERAEPADFDDFWRETLNANNHPLDFRATAFDSGLDLVDVYDISFSGYAHDRINGWYIEPKTIEADSADLPCIIHYLGYSIGRGMPHQWLTYAAAGFPVLVIETRGQGHSRAFPGSTPDPLGGTGAEFPGFLTRGIGQKSDYYLRRVYVDAYRAVDIVGGTDRVRAQRAVIVAGSQGAGIGLAVAGLRQNIDRVIADVPSFTHFKRATEISNVGARNEISQYLAVYPHRESEVFELLSYFDVMNFGVRATATAHFSTALMDQICPPSTVFAAHNYYAGPKTMRVWNYNGHEGGGPHEVVDHLHLLREQYAPLNG